MNTVHEINEAFGASGRAAMAVGDGEHRFFADGARPVFTDLVGWLDT